MSLSLPPVPFPVRAALALLYAGGLGFALLVAGLLFVLAGGFMGVENPDADQERLLALAGATGALAAFAPSLWAAIRPGAVGRGILVAGALAQFAFAALLVLESPDARGFVPLFVLGGAGSLWLALALRSAPGAATR